MRNECVMHLNVYDYMFIDYNCQLEYQKRVDYQRTRTEITTIIRKC